MPEWIYAMPPLRVGVLMVAGVEAIALAGLFLARRFLLPRFRWHDGVTDAISGTVQSIGVFYGLTVGLIAIAVWETHSDASETVSRKAAAIAALYRDVSGYPSPLREKLQGGLAEFTHAVVEKVWDEQRHGRTMDVGTRVLNQLQRDLFTYEPTSAGQRALHEETLRAFNILINERRVRIDAVTAKLAPVMWAVIWIGAAFSIGVAYLYKIEDPKLHGTLVALMAGFLSIVIFMIAINDRPFMGVNGITPESYQLVLDGLIEMD